MRTVALLMAGGRGERMRASGVDRPKPLVPVGGVPLVERNLHQLLQHRLTDIVVAVPAAESELVDFATGRLATVARQARADLRVLIEPLPLGNIGCAGSLRNKADTVLVVYADNLTTLDLGAMLRWHQRTQAAMTLAAHDESFRLPFGRLDIVAGRVVSYAEKPTTQITVCSGVAILGPPALKALLADRPTGLVDLAAEMFQRGEHVAAYEHTAAWVDVNDAAALARAEDLVVENEALFGCHDTYAQPRRRSGDSGTRTDFVSPE